MEDASMEESTRMWALLAIQYYRQKGGIMAEILTYQYTHTTLPEVREFEHRPMEAMRRFLVKQRDRLQVSDLDRTIYIAFTSCTALILKHLLEPVPYYNDTLIVEELVQLMARYFY